jgi:hypothetical protein
MPGSYEAMWMNALSCIISCLMCVLASEISGSLHQPLSATAKLKGGGQVFVPCGDVFCEDGEIIRIQNWLSASPEPQAAVEKKGTEHTSNSLDTRIEQTSRIWGRWKLDPLSNGKIEKLALCWETSGGFEATVCVTSGPWLLRGCGIVCGGGVCIEAADGTQLNVSGARIGGLGYGPRPYASVGLIAWSSGQAGSEITLADCKFSHIRSHTGRFLRGSSGRIESCTQSDCRKGFAASAGAKLDMESHSAVHVDTLGHTNSAKPPREKAFEQEPSYQAGS